VSPQGDRRCGNGPWASWSADLDALDSRIVAAFRALGHTEPITDVIVIGYSQGATRAEALARKRPERYTRLISIGAPQAPSVRGLSRLESAVMMAGELDRRDQMKAGARAFRAAGVPSTYVEIPGARHGEMGRTPEQTMGEALQWALQHTRTSSRPD
jgi:pimeloyl-ACP methyl ester carboxylesterase